MDRFNLSKPQKNGCRELIEKGYHKECRLFIDNLPKSISEGYQEGKSAPEIFNDIYNQIRKFHKELSLIYDQVDGSSYFLTVFNLYFRGIITDKDLESADDEFRAEIKALYALTDI